MRVKKNLARGLRNSVDPRPLLPAALPYCYSTALFSAPPRPWSEQHALPLYTPLTNRRVGEKVVSLFPSFSLYSFFFLKDTLVGPDRDQSRAPDAAPRGMRCGVRARLTLIYTVSPNGRCVDYSRLRASLCPAGRSHNNPSFFRSSSFSLSPSSPTTGVLSETTVPLVQYPLAGEIDPRIF